jgi:hypothetical protein
MAHLDTDIILPRRLQPFPAWIISTSPIAERRAVEKLATYFQRELGYDFTQYAAVENDKKCVVYTWDEQCFIRGKGEMGYQMFGAACFRFGKRIGPNFEGWFLQWVWLHPYFRNQGYLSRAWSGFLERFDRNFIPEWPYSAPIKSLLRKHLTPEQIAVLAKHGDAEKYITDDWKEDSVFPATSIPVSKFVPEELQFLLLRFFVYFSRFECALKRAGYAPTDGHAQADWHLFAKKCQPQFQADATALLSNACDYFEQHPSLKQIVTNGQLAWSSAESRGNQPQLAWLLKMVRRVRNNLFHGGKYPMQPVPDPARNADLLYHSLVLLTACLQLDEDVRLRFDDGND